MKIEKQAFLDMGYLDLGTPSQPWFPTEIPDDWQVLPVDCGRAVGDLVWNLRDHEFMDYRPGTHGPECLATSSITIRKKPSVGVPAMPTPNPESAPVAVGMKFDTGKPRWDLLPWKALAEVVKVLTNGAVKYRPGNWMHVKNARQRYSRAAMGHLVAWMDGEQNDAEWGLSHLAHGICCMTFLLWFEVAGKWPEEDKE